MVWKRFPIVKAQKVFVSFYLRMDPSWTFGNDNNEKLTDWSAAGDSAPYHTPYSDLGYWYLEYNSRFSSATGSGEWHSMGSLGGYGQRASNPFQDWVKVEMEFIFDANTGELRVWDNGRLVMSDGPGNTDPWSGTQRNFAVGGFQRPDLNWDRQPYINNFRYHTDIYIDTSWQRVVLCNAATYTACTVREMQIPSSWSDTAIGVALNRGRLAAGSTAYLYVVNASGNASAGFPVVLQ